MQATRTLVLIATVAISLANPGFAQSPATATKTRASNATKPLVGRSLAPPIKAKSATVPQKSTTTSTKPALVKKPAPAKKPAPVAATRPAPATVSPNGMPIWLDVESAKLASRMKGKLIMADFYTEECHWCKVMERTTFRDPRVTSILAKNYVCMRVDAHDGMAGTQLAERHDVMGFPTFMVFKSNGKALAKVEGYRNSEQFLAFLNEMSRLLKS